MFACPKCGSVLTRTRNEHGVYWTCCGCKGRAVTITVLKKAIRQDCAIDLWQRAFASSAVAGRSCPSCRHSMRGVGLRANGQAMRLDICPTCQFVWFDPDEFEALPAAPPPPVQLEDEVPLPVREAIALYEIEERAKELEAASPPAEIWKYVPACFGLPVECEVALLRRIPWVTWGTALAISLISLTAFSDLRSAISDFGLIPAQAFRDAGLTFLTSFFLHGGWFHLLVNLYFLLVFGDNVEDYLGSGRMLGLLVGAALLGDVIHVIALPTSTLPCVGASGGISGIITFYALKFPHARLRLLLRIGWRPVRWIVFSAKTALLWWIALQVIGMIQQMAGMSNVSAAAHLGGAAAGFCLWLAWRDK